MRRDMIERISFIGLDRKMSHFNANYCQHNVYRKIVNGGFAFVNDNLIFKIQSMICSVC